MLFTYKLISFEITNITLECTLVRELRVCQSFLGSLLRIFCGFSFSVMYIFDFSGKYRVNDHITSAALRNPGRPPANLCTFHSRLICYFMSNLLFSLKFHLFQGVPGVEQHCVHSWGREKVLFLILLIKNHFSPLHFDMLIHLMSSQRSKDIVWQTSFPSMKHIHSCECKGDALRTSWWPISLPASFLWFSDWKERGGDNTRIVQKCMRSMTIFIFVCK